MFTTAIRCAHMRQVSNILHRTLTTSPHPNISLQKPRDQQRMLARLLEQIGSRKEVEYYLKHYCSVEARKFAVIKVGGGVLTDELETLTESLTFLHSVGLTPIVIHGAGPQLNAELKSAGIVSDYIGGLRITTPDILKIAKKVFLKENLRLVRALEEYGTRARPIQTGVFESVFLDREKYQLVGQVTSVDPTPIYESIELGHLPILTCMGETKEGQLLNINADIAGRELARAIQPEKVVYISAVGGLRDQNDDIIRNIDLNEDYERLMNEPWFRHGNRLKLREIKELMDVLNSNSSVAITSAQNLPRELFTHQGMGTLIRKQERIQIYPSLTDLDTDALQRLIEDSFEGTLTPKYFESIQGRIYRVIIGEDYRGCAIVTKDEHGTPYLDKFAVARAHQSTGVANRMWERLKQECPTLYWRARTVNKINSWYFGRAQGTYTDPTATWTVFWYGMEGFQSAQRCIQIALDKPATIIRNLPLPTSTSVNLRGYHVATNRVGASTSQVASNSLVGNTPQASGTRSFSTSNQRRTTPYKVGLIGGRGYTGLELVQILDNHPEMKLSVVSSRAYKGQTLGEIAKAQLKTNSDLSSLVFVDLQPNDIAKHQDIDVWVIALPNGLASPFVQAIDNFSPKSLVVDLSADYRFDSNWTYGCPERKDVRAKLRTAKRISNPGCYATGMHLSLLPLVYGPTHSLASHACLLDTSRPPVVFGVSGYSGAGTTPSRKNDTKLLHDNLMPYSLSGHIHEKEVSHQIADLYKPGIRFMPHVASWFRGISLTLALSLNTNQHTSSSIMQIYKQYYENEPLVQVTQDIVEVSNNANKHHVAIGAFDFKSQTKQLVLTTTLDNLLKGAATQCIQNINIACDLPELSGVSL